MSQDQFTAGGGRFNFGKYNLQSTYHYWSYQATTDYDINQNLHLYARTGRGQRSGGYSIPISSAAAAAPFKPEELTDYEIGLKTVGLLDGALSFNADYYYGKYRDIQRLLSHLVLLPSGQGVFVSSIINAAGATVSGVETEFNWRLLKPLTLTGYGTYTDAHYNDFPYQPTAAPATNLRDQPFYQTPEWMARLGATYEVPVSYGSWRLNVGWNWQSTTSLMLITDSHGYQPAYNLVDARLSWTSPNKAWEVSVYGTNLTGTHYYTYGQYNNKTFPTTIPRQSFFVVGDPRIYAAEIAYHFEK
ncbi:MAG: TonB-dependent receptor [Sinobacteraceae bacterium]|nr:TonB-dependent receptor [Nevskiaceae bacterium]